VIATLQNGVFFAYYEKQSNRRHACSAGALHMPPDENHYREIRDFLAKTDPLGEQCRGIVKYLIGMEAEIRSCKRNISEDDRRFIEFANEINSAAFSYSQRFPNFSFNFWSIFRRLK
jgi:hypothetical protein